MISAFGGRAQAYAPGLPDLEAVVADTDSLLPAIAEATRRRKLGESFYGMVLDAEPRAQLICGLAHDVLVQIPDLDLRRAALERLGAGEMLVGTRTAEEVWNEIPETRAAMCEFLALAGGTLVRSFAEGARLTALCPRRLWIEPVLVEPEVPQVRPRVGSLPGVVIWAPNYSAMYVSWYAFALTEFFGNVTCVAWGGTPAPNLRANFITPADPLLPGVLIAAQCVLCVDPDDPGAAVAFSRLGFGVAAPVSSGAREYVRDVVSFELRAPRDVEMAVKIAIAKPASLRATPCPPQMPFPAAV